MFFQLAFPKRVTFKHSPSEYKRVEDIIRRMNGKVSIYRSVHDFYDFPSADTAIIKKFFFDFDYDSENPTKCLEDIQTLHEWLNKKKYGHSIFFSGRGFHCFVKAMFSKTPKNAQVAIRKCFYSLMDSLDIRSDSTYDIMRVARLPNTLNTKSKRFCIPLKENEIYWNYDEIANLARAPRNIQNYINGGYLDLTKYDCFEFSEDEINKLDGIEIDEEMDVNLSEFPPCVRNLFNKKILNYRERFIIILAFKELCYPQKVLVSFLKKILDPKKFYHCIYEENQVEYLYSRSDLFFPSCATLKGEGFCYGPCSNKIYL